MANSIYTSLDNIITFAATHTSITILSERLSGTILVIEEKQSSFDDSKISTLVYSLAEGRTRLKATKESDLITNIKFELNVLTSAEENLNDGIGTHTGASRRTMEIYANKIFSSDKKCVRAHRISRQAYGIAGNVFINKLIEKYAHNGYEEVINKYEDIESILKEKSEDDVVNSYIQSMAVIVLADILMNQFFDFGFDEESSIQMGLKIIKMLETEKEIDEVEKAKEIIEDWIISNDYRFDRHSYTTEYVNVQNIQEVREIIDGKENVEKLGLYDKGIYYIVPLKFNEIISKYNMKPNKIRKGFAERGYILIDEANHRFLVSKFYNGSTKKMVAFKMENEKTRDKKEIGELIEENKVESTNGTIDFSMFEESVESTLKNLGIRGKENE